jgi:hypothetical protein
MTREDAIKSVKKTTIKLVKEVAGMSLDWDDAHYDALQMAIKALEQEPCEDTISRAEAEAIFRNARSKLNPSEYKTADEFNTRDLMLLNAEQLIHLLPSVKSQEPKKESEKCNYTIQNDLVVDGCRHKPVASTFSFFNECGDYKFCPYCGRKIEIEVEQ